jgi:hypothetical protein
MKIEFKKIKHTVELVLKYHPETRDDDNKLIIKIWEYKYPGIYTLEVQQLINLIIQKKLPSTESIRRMRQKIQETDVQLRGDKYLNRHQASKEIKQYFKQKPE